MLGTSQGNSCPDTDSTTSTTTRREFSAPVAPDAVTHQSPPSHDLAYLDAITRAQKNVARVEKINIESDQRGRTWSIPVPPEMQSTTPVWSGRAIWQRQVREILNSDSGIQECRRHSIDPERVFAVAVCMASVADQRTGRRVTASRETLAERAGVSITVLKRARRVLSELGMAHEMVRGRFLRTIEQWAAEAHHGRKQVKATSVWALTSPRSVVTRVTSAGSPTDTPPTTRVGNASRDPRTPTPPIHPQSRTGGPQSLGVVLCSSTSVRKYKTTRARTHAAGASPSRNENPRPIQLQKAAAELISLAPSLDTGRHIGSVCDALRDHCVDTTRWTGRDIARTLNEDTKLRGWTWPERGSLRHPIRFLRWRLARIDWSGPSPSERARAAKLERDLERRRASVAASDRDMRIASTSTRMSVMNQIREALSRRRSNPSGSAVR